MGVGGVEVGVGDGDLSEVVMDCRMGGGAQGLRFGKQSRNIHYIENFNIRKVERVYSLISRRSAQQQRVRRIEQMWIFETFAFFWSSQLDAFLDLYL